MSEKKQNRRIRAALKKAAYQNKYTRMLIISRYRHLRFLDGITKEQKGLEIGPSHHPVAAKRDGYDVEIVDWLDQAGLREHYKEDGVDLEAIEPVDYVWHGGSYYDLIQKEHYYDYIIASHMIEHCADLIGFLKDCSKLLKKDGIVRLAVPDKRYCFDYYRNTTGVAEVLNNYYEPSDHQSPGSVGDYFYNIVHRKEKISWDKKSLPIGDYFVRCRRKNFQSIHHEDEVVEKILEAHKGEYIDIHHYVFTPASFQLLIYDLRVLKMTDMKIAHMWNTKGNEFIVTLQKTDEVIGQDFPYRQKLLKKCYRQNRI